MTITRNSYRVQVEQVQFLMEVEDGLVVTAGGARFEELIGKTLAEAALWISVRKGNFNKISQPEHPVIEFDKIPEELKAEDILAFNADVEIYEYYLGSPVVVNKKISSPFRGDKNPSFCFFQAGLAVRWKDFGTGESGDVFDFVKKMFGVDYHIALKMVSSDMRVASRKEARRNSIEVVKNIPDSQGLSSLEQVLRDRKEHKLTIRVEDMAYTPTDAKYWMSYGINLSTLAKFDLMTCKRVWIQGYMHHFGYSSDNPIYAYQFGRYPDYRYKIYRPLEPDKKDKWRNNCNQWDIFGMKQLAKYGDFLIITKSGKDVMLLSEMGFNAIAPQSESTIIPQGVVDELAKRGYTLITLFDRDYAGTVAARKYNALYSTYTAQLRPDEPKDISDFVKEKGRPEGFERVVGLLQSAIGISLNANEFTHKSNTRV